MSDMDVIRDAVAGVLRQHGTAYLLPDDEFDCCVEEVVKLFEQVAWFQPNRQPGEQFWPSKWEPNEQWARPCLPVFTLVGRHSDTEKGTD